MRLRFRRVVSFRCSSVMLSGWYLPQFSEDRFTSSGADNEYSMHSRRCQRVRYLPVWARFVQHMNIQRSRVLQSPIIATLNSSKNCPNCGKSHDTTANFCGACRQPFVVPKSINCTQCQAVNTQNALSCRVCGHAFTASPNAAPTPLSAAPVPSNAAPVTPPPALFLSQQTPVFVPSPPQTVVIQSGMSNPVATGAGLGCGAALGWGCLAPLLSCTGMILLAVIFFLYIFASISRSIHESSNQAPPTTISR